MAGGRLIIPRQPERRPCARCLGRLLFGPDQRAIYLDEVEVDSADRARTIAPKRVDLTVEQYERLRALGYAR
jgi:hypothetical protein